MESATSDFYANDLFVFNPNTKHFYAHEEFLYQFSGSSTHTILNISSVYLDYLKHQTPSLDLNKKDNLILQSKDDDLSIRDDPTKQLSSNEPNQDLNADLLDQNPDLQKHNFDVFLDIVDLSQYSTQLSVQDFFELYYTWLGQNDYKFAGYLYFRKKGYEIESGCTFSFDYLLYKQGKTDTGLLNKSERTHSQYGVCFVSEDSEYKITFNDLHRKHRIAHNYNKVRFHSLCF